MACKAVFDPDLEQRSKTNKGFRVSAEAARWQKAPREPRRNGPTGDDQISSREERE